MGGYHAANEEVPWRAYAWQHYVRYQALEPILEEDNPARLVYCYRGGRVCLRRHRVERARGIWLGSSSLSSSRDRQ